MKKLFGIIWIIMLGMWGYPANNVGIENYGLQEGLSQSVVTDIHVDSKGFIWIGTQDGLNRYDGYEFRKYYSDHNVNYSLTSNYITSITEDANQNIWIGTRSGLNLYDSKKEQFYHYGLPGNEFVFPEVNIRSITVDGENFVWVLVDSYLIRINHVARQMRVFSFGNYVENKLDCPSSALFESSSGNLWFVHEQRLIMFDKVFERFEFYDLNEKLGANRCLRSVFEYGQSIFAESNGVVFKLKDNESEIIFLDGESVNLSICYNYLERLYYLTSDFRVSRLDNMDGNSNKFHFETLATFDDPLRPSISAFDHSHNLWIGTSGRGVMKFNLKKNDFNSFTRSISKDHQLADDQISSIYIEDGLAFVGTYGFGLYIIDLKKRVVDKAFLPEEHSVLVDNTIYDIEKYYNGFILGSSTGILFLDYNRPQNSFKLSQQYKMMTFGKVYDVEVIEDTSLFFTSKGRLMHLGLISGERKVWEFNHEKDAVNQSYCLEFIDNENVFLGTGQGLIRLNLGTSQWDRSIFELDDTTSIINNTIYSLEYDVYGKLWVGTAGGLDCIENPKAYNLSFSHILPSSENTIYSMLSNKNYVFIGTGNGLYRYKYENGSLSVFHMQDGLPCDEFNIGVTSKLKDGRMAFGGQGGFAVFHPDSVELNSFQPKVEITKAIIYGKEGKRIINAYSGKEIRLDVHDFLLNIYFTSLDFTSPGKNIFRYKINQSDWIELGHQNYTSFSNLQPGEYNITINGSNSDHIWSLDTAFMTVLVPKSWYVTSFAILVYIIVFFGLLLFAYQMRTKRLRLTNQVLREKEAAAVEVSRQKNRLAALHKSMTESMGYAKRIQKSLFPTEYNFKKILPESFIMFRPKEAISGDFYWISEVNGKICVAAVDCTGHGVPGSLMSVIAIELLKRVVLQEGYQKPSEILNQLDRGVHDVFRHDEDYNMANGMDISLCIIDRESLVFQYAGAVNSLYQVSGGNIKEVKADRVPVGLAKSMNNYKYTNHFIEYDPDDVFYLFSDGYADQFGGRDGKKYKYKRFKTFIESISHLETDMQQVLLDNNFIKWKGSREQLDDVLVVGFKVNF